MSKADVIEVEGVVVEKLPNAFFTLGILTSFQAALTLPGLAGMVLSACGLTIILMPFSSRCTSISVPDITGSPS